MSVDVALDGVDAFLSACDSTPIARPHKAAAIHCHATEGRSWRLMLDGNGAWPAPHTSDDAMPATASATGTAEEPLIAGDPEEWS
ncbi:hypothetical protein ACGFYV_04990 [Streptomyces sp. NPDC048297]|uniref:hypothetical protein n=1 Tax=Streptomyces sp. NPDC048297 TaxID=3365531 RepID=UPI0037179865